MENKTPNVEVNGSLMRKTKKDLVEIILRKDDIEKGFINKCKELQNEITQLNNRLSSSFNDMKGTEKRIRQLEKERNSAIADFEYSCDNHAVEIQEFKNQIKLYKLATLIMTAVAIASLLFGYMGI